MNNLTLGFQFGSECIFKKPPLPTDEIPPAVKFLSGTNFFSPVNDSNQSINFLLQSILKVFLIFSGKNSCFVEYNLFLAAKKFFSPSQCLKFSISSKHFSNKSLFQRFVNSIFN